MEYMQLLKVEEDCLTYCREFSYSWLNPGVQKQEIEVTELVDPIRVSVSKSEVEALIKQVKVILFYIF
jgi:hypothetical protein